MHVADANKNDLAAIHLAYIYAGKNILQWSCGRTRNTSNGSPWLLRAKIAKGYYDDADDDEHDDDE